MSVIDNQNTLLNMKNDTTKVNYENGRQRLGSSELGQDAFLQLLLAQLQHQDPLDPVDNSQFISQQAQFTQIEKTDKLINAINSGNLISQSSSLVGKTVQIQLDGGQTTIGKIDSIQIGNNSLGINVGNEVYSSNQIIQVFADTP